MCVCVCVVCVFVLLTNHRPALLMNDATEEGGEVTPIAIYHDQVNWCLLFTSFNLLLTLYYLVVECYMGLPP